ncbi:MAG: Rrf2 family transcriptional regulator [Bacteroidales bacterium]|jgi:Rrf2 family protein|nr:Rrf2 family transcriptional regulator [Bacteroidales bacterium]MCU0408025.1 Rrf2 family transcriptional regulator [Bacteroidales bacterium]
MFNKETEYALRGLVYIKLQNLNERRPGVTEISKEIGAPHFFTAKILQKLVRAGFVESLKGKGGGFYFDISKPELPIRNLIASIEGEKSFTGCAFGLKQCDENQPCPMHERFAPIREAIRNLVDTETVQTLALKLQAKGTGKTALDLINKITAK